MKSYIKISMLSLAVLSFTFSGCLKDKDFEDGKIQSVHNPGGQNVIEIGVTATSNLGYMNIALPNKNADTTFNLIPVVYNGDKPAKEDIKVVVVLNMALIGDYNSNPDHGTAHEPAPSNTYTVLNPPAAGGGWEVIIPKGSNVGYLQIKVNPTKFLGFDYAVAFQISKILTPGYLVSSNLSTGIVAIGIKNEWEGEYHTTGFFQHPSVPRDIDQDDYLKTAGATSVYKTLGDLTGTNIIITINPGNTVTISPGPGTSGTTASVDEMGGDPVYNNTYDPATKTFWLKYGYPQPGPSRIITEKVALK
jgi:hypothetical protein